MINNRIERNDFNRNKKRKVCVCGRKEGWLFVCLHLQLNYHTFLDCLHADLDTCGVQTGILGNVGNK